MEAQLPTWSANHRAVYVRLVDVSLSNNTRRLQQRDGASLVHILANAFDSIEFCQTGVVNPIEFTFNRLARDLVSKCIGRYQSGEVAKTDQDVLPSCFGFAQELLIRQDVMQTVAAF